MKVELMQIMDSHLGRHPKFHLPAITDVTILNFYSISDLLGKIGGNFTTIKGVILGASSLFILKSWEQSIYKECIKYNDKLENEPRAQTIERIQERVSFRGIYNLFDTV